MRGNAAILKCLIPSFVADFVQITAWVDDEGNEFVNGNDDYNGNEVYLVEINLESYDEVEWFGNFWFL